MSAFGVAIPDVDASGLDYIHMDLACNLNGDN